MDVYICIYIICIYIIYMLYIHLYISNSITGYILIYNKCKFNVDLY